MSVTVSGHMSVQNSKLFKTNKEWYNGDMFVLVFHTVILLYSVRIRSGL